MTDFRIVHFSPGRLRLRLQQVRDEPGFGDQLQQLLTPLEGIRSVRVSRLTGSVLVEFDPDRLDIPSLLDLGRFLGVVPSDLPPLESLAVDAPLEGTLRKVGENLGLALEQGGRLAGRILDPRLALSALVFHFAVRGLGGGAALTLSPGVAAALVLASIVLETDDPESKLQSHSRLRAGSGTV